jgi:DNA polymerase-3 subunit epsilon
MKNLVIFDLETTGVDKSKDQIIQFAAIKVNPENHQVIDSKNLFIQPIGNYQISLQAYFKHGIKPDDLKDKPHFKDVANEIVEFIKDCDIVTYNGNGFDIPFLLVELNRVGVEFSFMNTKCYDTYVEERKRNGMHLGEVYQRYKGKSMEEAGLQAHDALSDVKATLSIFAAQQKHQQYNPEKMYGEDNVIIDMIFNNEIKPCFNIGKYRGISVETVALIDQKYIQWCTSSNCGFIQSTKNYLKKYIK